MFTSFLIALSLNFDSFAVAIIQGVQNKKTRLSYLFTTSLIFGLTQAGLLLFGSLLGFGFMHFISQWDHWIAFILLLLVGYKMITQSHDHKISQDTKQSSNVITICLLSFATSIDSLIVGITLPFLNISILNSSILVFIVTFCVVITGLYFGSIRPKLLSNKTTLLGGFILILLALKILFEHLFFTS